MSDICKNHSSADQKSRLPYDDTNTGAEYRHHDFFYTRHAQCTPSNGCDLGPPDYEESRLLMYLKNRIEFRHWFAPFYGFYHMMYDLELLRRGVSVRELTQRGPVLFEEEIEHSRRAAGQVPRDTRIAATEPARPFHARGCPSLNHCSVYGQHDEPGNDSTAHLYSLRSQRASEATISPRTIPRNNLPGRAYRRLSDPPTTNPPPAKESSHQRAQRLREGGDLRGLSNSTYLSPRTKRGTQAGASGQRITTNEHGHEHEHNTQYRIPSVLALSLRDDDDDESTRQHRAQYPSASLIGMKWKTEDLERLAAVCRARYEAARAKGEETDAGRGEREIGEVCRWSDLGSEESRDEKVRTWNSGGAFEV